MSSAAAVAAATQRAASQGQVGGRRIALAPFGGVAQAFTSPHTSRIVVRATRSYWRVSDEMLTTAGLTAQTSAASAPSRRSKPRARANPKIESMASAAKTRLSARPAHAARP